ncbi:MAG: ABC transporter permease [candidate division Zixibacteria bacterium HGW-Zixibacteria-1]|nr:MAG: ABC transporter permease [candidate division Zixibacteria bacterium HGW-Zixibacteria-1]
MNSGVPLIGRRAINFISRLGSTFLLLFKAVYHLKSVPRSLGLIVDQCFMIGNKSIPLILIISIFVGAVSSWQAAYQFKFIGAPLRYLGSAVGKAIVIELAPVLSALVVAGRVGAGIAAELGTMRVTEQIDALESMGISPVRYLVMPRLVASTIMLPILVIFSNFIAVLGALAVSVLFVDISYETFLNGVRFSFSFFDMMGGMLKATVFGAIIGLVGCHEGFRAAGGARGVGISTTYAVVISSVMILVSDYVIAMVLFRM